MNFPSNEAMVECVRKIKKCLKNDANFNAADQFGERRRGCSNWQAAIGSVGLARPSDHSKFVTKLSLGKRQQVR